MIITCQRYGRLGNQLFQLSNLIGFALRHNLEFRIPRFVTCPPGLKTDPDYFTHLPTCEIYPFIEYGAYREPTDQSFKEIPVSITQREPAFIELQGYFQSEKYFADQRPGVLKALNIPWIPHDGIVSIHVRRGDYLEKPLCHPVPELEYYVEAIRYFNKLGYYKFRVFSDDIQFAYKMFSDKVFAKSTINFHDSGNPVHLLSTMSCSEHHIIANSSFSWWGAWLNQNPDKIVVAPKVWYGPELSHVNTKYLLPEKWIRM